MHKIYGKEMVEIIFKHHLWVDFKSLLFEYHFQVIVCFCFVGISLNKNFAFIVRLTPGLWTENSSIFGSAFRWIFLFLSTCYMSIMCLLLARFNFICRLFCVNGSIFCCKLKRTQFCCSTKEKGATKIFLKLIKNSK